MEDFVIDNFKGCVLDTFELPHDTDLMVCFPMLKRLLSFEYDFQDVEPDAKKAKVFKNRMIRYINYFYSYNAKHLRERFPDAQERKIQCAKLAGFEFKDGKMSDVLKDALFCKNPQVNFMVVEFVRHNYSDKVSNFLMTRDSLYALQLQNINEPKGSDIEKVDKISKSLEAMEDRLLGGDNAKEISENFIMIAEATRLGLRPEDIAKRVSEGKQPIDFEVYD